jgi:hypothetical protein
MDSRISAAVSAGSIDTEDQEALGKALDAIDATLQAGRTSGSRPSGDMKTRMDSLIDQQVEAGTLTDEQAEELKELFAAGPANGAQGPGGMGGPGCAGGPPPSSESDEEEDETVDAAEAAAKQLDAIMAFLETLRNSLSSGLYGESGTTSGGGNAGLVVDTQA